MSGLEQRITWLKAELQICSKAQQIQEAAERAMKGSTEDMNLVVTLVRGMSASLSINRPASREPEAWLMWLEAWNRWALVTDRNDCIVRTREIANENRNDKNET